MYHYTLRVKHDAGYVTIRTTARDEQSARTSVCNAERCPSGAIRRVWRGRDVTARKVTRATRVIHEQADFCRASGVRVDWDSGYSTVSIDGKTDGESVFMQGDEADEFIGEIDALCKRFPSLDEYTAALALAKPYVENLF